MVPRQVISAAKTGEETVIAKTLSPMIKGLAAMNLRILLDCICTSPGIKPKGLARVRVRRSAVESIAAKIGCTAQTLLTWVRQHERDTGQREGPTTADQKRVKELEREVKELRKANEILKLASAFFAQAELDRRFKS